MGVSPSTVFRRLRDVSYPKPTVLPQVLSIDEFRGNAGGQKFQAILTNPKSIRLLTYFPQEHNRCLPVIFVSLKTEMMSNISLWT